jgi:hypothetical protein
VWSVGWCSLGGVWSGVWGGADWVESGVRFTVWSLVRFTGWGLLGGAWVTEWSSGWG